MVKLRVIGEASASSSAWPVAPGEAPKAIGPDYAALRARNWARVHIAADQREPFAFQNPLPPVKRR